MSFNWTEMLKQVEEHEAVMTAAGIDLAEAAEREANASAPLWGEDSGLGPHTPPTPLTPEERERARVVLPPQRLQGVDSLSGRPPEQAMVPGYILERGLFQIAGEPYTGKTAFTVNLACTIAAGLDEWMGLPTDLDAPGDVVYVALEGGQPFLDAVQAWAVANPEADLSGFKWLDGGEGYGVRINTNKRDEEPEYMESLGYLIDNIKEADLKPRMVIFDTQIDLAPGMDENSAGEMAMLLNALDSLAMSEHCVVVLIHHLNKTGQYRGSSAQFGKVWMAATLTNDNGTREMTFTKVKGARQPEEPLTFHLTGVNIPDGSGTGPIVVTGPAPTAASLSRDQKAIVEVCADGGASVHAIRKGTNFGRDKAVRIVKQLVEDGVLVEDKTGGVTSYRVREFELNTSN